MTRAPSLHEAEHYVAGRFDLLVDQFKPTVPAHDDAPECDLSRRSLPSRAGSFSTWAVARAGSPATSSVYGRGRGGARRLSRAC